MKDKVGYKIKLHSKVGKVADLLATKSNYTLNYSLNIDYISDWTITKFRRHLKNYLLIICHLQ